MIILLKRQNVKLIILLAVAIILIGAINSGFRATHDVIQQEAKTVLAENNNQTLPEGIHKLPSNKIVDLPQKPLIENTLLTSAESNSLNIEANQVINADPIWVEEEPSVDVLSLKMDRSQNHSQQQEMLENILSNESISAEAKAEAENKLLRLAETSAMELQAETMLQTKGYHNIVVMIDFDNATVYTTDNLAESDYAKIGDLVHKSTNFSLEQIVIIPK